MVKSTVLKRIIPIVLVLFIAAGILMYFSFDRKTASGAASVILEENALSDTYALGSEFTPPTAKIVYGEKEYDAIVKSLVFPNGTAYKQTTYLLSVPGKYTLNYVTTVDEKPIEACVYFIVAGNAYSVSTSNSSASYGMIENTDGSGKNLYKVTAIGANTDTEDATAVITDIISSCAFDSDFSAPTVTVTYAEKKQSAIAVKAVDGEGNKSDVVYSVTVVHAEVNEDQTAEEKAKPKIDTYSISLAETYILGKEFTVPETDIIVNDNSYPAKVKSITDPNKEQLTGEKFTFVQPGIYAVNYFTTINDEEITASFSFKISNPTSTFVGKGTYSFDYVVYAEDGTTVDVNASFEIGEKVTTSGIIVNLSAGDVFTYNNPIDLSKMTKSDNLLEFFALPNTLGKADVSVLKVRLTDAYDTNNYVDVVTNVNLADVDDATGKRALYSGAAANGQILSGLHFKARENDNTFVYQGQNYALVKDVKYSVENGYPSYEFSFVAKRGYGQGAYNLAFDFAENQVYGCKQFDCVRPVSEASNGMIIDLDDPMFFENPWSGFTTGEVYVSIFAENYSAPTFNFIVTDIADEDLTKSHFVDNVAPNIEIDVADKNNVPSAIVGQNYKIYSAKAFDAVDGEMPLSTVVYRNYDSSNPTIINVVNGVFVPDKESVYTIVYTATDNSGNVAMEKIYVSAKKTSNLEIVLGDGVEQSTVGKLVNLKHPTVLNADGSFDIRVSVVSSDNVTEVEVNKKGEYTFIPMQAGEYTVKYTCTDYNTTKETTYKLTVKGSDIPVIISEPNLPPVFVNCVSYVLPTLKGYDFSSGTPVDRTCDVSYSFDGAPFKDYTLGQELKIEAIDNVTLRYTIGSAPESNREYVIPVADVGISRDLHYRQKYFFGKHFTVNSEGEVVYSTTAKNADLTFVNKLLVSNFELTYTIKNADFNLIKFTLTGCENSNEILEVAVRPKDAANCYVSINSGEEISLSRAIGEANTTINYNDINRILKLGGVSYSLGDFEGFTGRLAWLNISVEGNNGITQLAISEINDQQITFEEVDNSVPQYSLIVNNDEKVVGEKLVISEFIAADVLKFKSLINLTVLDPDGNACVSTNGVTMRNVSDFSTEYVIDITKTGSYRITGYCSDGENKNNITKQLSVKDNVAPILVVEEADFSASLGKKVSVAEYSVSDTTDSVENIKVTVCVMRPDLRTINVTDGKFTADIKGVYTVMYYAVDATGNIGFYSYEVSVG